MGPASRGADRDATRNALCRHSLAMTQLSKPPVSKRVAMSRFDAGRCSVSRRPAKTPGAEMPLRMLVLYGSCRSGSSSRALAQEAARVARDAGAQVQIFEPEGLPLAGNDDVQNAKLKSLHELVAWADGYVWCSPEHHGAMSGVMKLILDCYPCDNGRPADVQGKTVMLMQVSGGSLSSNAISDMQRVAAAMALHVLPKTVAVPKAAGQFDEAGKLRDGSLDSRLESRVREFVKLTLLHRANARCLSETSSKIA